MNKQHKGKSAVVTGSSKGIGYAIAESLIDAGVNVAVSARDETEVREAAERLTERGPGRAIGVAADVRRYADVERLVNRTAEEFGQLDILINNAGVGRFAPIGEMNIEDWDQIIETNLSGVFYCCHEALPHLRKSGDAWIINIASLAGKNPFAGGAAYNASKFGLVGFSEAMMLDVRHDGIRVSYIMPGSVATHFGGHTPNEKDAWKIQPEDIAQSVMDLLNLPSRTLVSRVEVRPSQPPKK